MAMAEIDFLNVHMQLGNILFREAKLTVGPGEILDDEFVGCHRM
jgi:hypothetical protein